MRRDSSASCAAEEDSLRESARVWSGDFDCGRSSQKVLPFSSVLLTPIDPFIAWTRRWQRARPRPVPSTADCSAPRRSNGVKSRANFSTGIPAPVSRTEIRIRSLPESANETFTQPLTAGEFTLVIQQIHYTNFYT